MWLLSAFYMVDISIVVPAYDEEKSVEKTIKELQGVIKQLPEKNFEVIFIDDGSKDKTAERIKKHSGVVLLQHKTNRGYGAALKTGIAHAKGEWILIMDCDRTYPADRIPDLVKRADEGFDMIVGARTGKIVKVPFFRRPAKLFLRFLVNYLSGKRIPDFNSGFRIFKKSLALRYFSLFPNGFSFTTTITIAAMTNNYEVDFIPTNYYKREGKSNIRPLHDFVNFTTLIFRLIMYFRPLSIFIPVSLLFFVVGFAKITVDAVRLNHFGLGGALLIIASVQLLFLGMLADMVIKRTNL
jgi:glycosyltransferase involved in cell wall biosynthesis